MGVAGSPHFPGIAAAAVTGVANPSANANIAAQDNPSWNNPGHEADGRSDASGSQLNLIGAVVRNRYQAAYSFVHFAWLT